MDVDPSIDWSYFENAKKSRWGSGRARGGGGGSGTDAN